MMIYNLTGLAQEVGSGSTDPQVQLADIQKSVKEYTEGMVWLQASPSGIRIRSNEITYSEVLRYPFDSDDFWKTVDYVYDESLNIEEEEDDYFFDLFDEDEEDL